MGYVLCFALFAAASAALFGGSFVQSAAVGRGEVAWWLAAAMLFVGSGAFGAVVHARPFVEEATVRAGSLVLIRSRYRRRRAFVGSLADGLRVQVRGRFGIRSDGDAPGELLFSVPGRAASFGNVLPRETLEALRAQIDAALAGAV